MAVGQADFDIDVLVIGTGPAGAATALALATYGVKVLVVNKFGSTARTPRAHITNQRTLEVIRDLNIEDEVNLKATPNDLMGENTFCTSLAGDEIGRIHTWGTHPLRRAQYEMASPTMICDIPQSLLEPIMIQNAAQRGAKARFDTEYVAHEQDDEGVTTTLRDRLTNQDIKVRSRYLVGADGANSKVLDDLGLPLEGQMGLSGSINMVFRADLSKYVAHRPSVLYWIIQPGSAIGGLGIGVVRMVEPWRRWLAIWGYDVEQGPPDIDNTFATSIVHKLIGDDTIPVEIESTSTWTVNDMYATELSRGRVFCMGDAVHRHPPTNGLGSNTSIQDGYNLAWKLAYVLQGKAGPELLDTYNAERAPIAEQIVKRANKSLGDLPPVAKALGLLDAKTPEEMNANMAARAASTPQAAEQRKQLFKAIAGTDYVYNAHGVEMNQRYASAAVVPDGTPDPGFSVDEELYHEASARPGAHVPHVWLATKSGRAAVMDLCGGGKFAVLTGPGGECWAEAAATVAAELGVVIDAHVIGPGRAYEDPYGAFAAVREVEDDGVLLVRPDLHIGWRAHRASETATEDLRGALEAILATRSAQTQARDHQQTQQRQGDEAAPATA